MLDAESSLISIGPGFIMTFFLFFYFLRIHQNSNKFQEPIVKECMVLDFGHLVTHPFNFSLDRLQFW
ncbi:MAG: hypothetical protein A2156_03365 [Deltaproteobacteria bacterium RBG_16_48_10]|nr:MAG: hypothetical protein A2156_03365 [Deltaproteobacteria bacterium RBG_16_48_10]